MFFVLCLQEPSSIEKVAEIDEHIGCAMSGLTADAKTLIDHARADTQVSSTPEAQTVGQQLLYTCMFTASMPKNGGAPPLGWGGGSPGPGQWRAAAEDSCYQSQGLHTITTVTLQLPRTDLDLYEHLTFWSAATPLHLQ